MPIAWPLAWYYLHDWLEGFAYRISLNPLYFLAAGVAALVIAWATIFTHARRVARANPIHALALRVGGTMFRNYLIIALRNIARHKLYSFINIAGLAVGLTCAILIMLFVRDELSYDKWIPGSENLYRVEVTYHPPGPSRRCRWPRPPCRCRPRCAIIFPEVRAMTRLGLENMAITVGDRHFSERVHGGGSEFPAGHPAAAGGGRSAHRAGASGIGGPDPIAWRGNISAMPIRSARRSLP